MIPALPWAPGDEGIIKLNTPITKDDILEGALLISVDGGPNDGVIIAKCVADGERIGVSVGGDNLWYINSFTGSVSQLEVVSAETGVTGYDIVSIERTVPMTEIEYYGAVKIDGGYPPVVGEDVIFTGYNGGGNVCLLSQDGETVIGGKYQDNNFVSLMESAAIINENVSFIKLPKPTQGSLASLPLVNCKVVAQNGKWVLQIQQQQAQFYISLIDQSGQPLSASSVSPVTPYVIESNEM